MVKQGGDYKKILYGYVYIIKKKKGKKQENEIFWSFALLFTFF